MKTTAIKSMKLYSRVERIYDELRNIGIGEDDPLTVADLLPFDQYHYFGALAVDQAIAALAIEAAGRVLDVGSGLGGPARYMAEKTGCRVTAIELQSDLDDVARSLTARCGLAGRVEHVCGDVLTAALEAGGYDAVVSWLAVYHIAEPGRLFARLHDALRPGGMIYVEDFFLHGGFSAEEQPILDEVIYAQSLPKRDEYIGHLKDAGFHDIRFEDMTGQWMPFVIERATAYRARLDEHRALHGREMTDALDRFYDGVATLFRGGSFGGLRVTAKRA